MSSSPPSLTTISANLATTPANPQRAKLAEAAKQFEAIFVRQMLAAARKADFGGDNVFGGQEMASFRAMQDERFADIAAQRGSFGLAKMIETRLSAQLPPSPLPLAGGAGGGSVMEPRPTSPPLTPPASRRGTEVSNSPSGGA
jgi:flagellar protein FlgJ